jgi:hypothetical protein
MLMLMLTRGGEGGGAVCMASGEGCMAVEADGQSRNRTGNRLGLVEPSELVSRPHRAVRVPSRSGLAVVCVDNKRPCFVIRRRRVSGEMSRPMTAPDAGYMAEIPNTQATKRGPAVRLVFTRPADAIGRAASTRRPPGTLPAPLDGDRRSRLCAQRWVVRPR